LTNRLGLGKPLVLAAAETRCDGGERRIARQMSALATLLWILNLICVTAGHLSLKAAATIAAPDTHGLARWKAMFADVWVWLGVSAFAAEFLLWLAFLSLVPLSLAVLVGSIDTLAVSLGGRIFFGEALTIRRTVSILLIAVGVALVGWG
jgi:drug/metabolite transporter (DMT)-like permease